MSVLCSFSLCCSLFAYDYQKRVDPVGIYLLKVYNEDTRTRRRSDVFIVNFEHILRLFLVFIVNFEHVIADWDLLLFIIKIFNVGQNIA